MEKTVALKITVVLSQWEISGGREEGYLTGQGQCGEWGGFLSERGQRGLKKGRHGSRAQHNRGTRVGSSIAFAINHQQTGGLGQGLMRKTGQLPLVFTVNWWLDLDGSQVGFKIPDFQWMSTKIETIGKEVLKGGTRLSPYYQNKICFVQPLFEPFNVFFFFFKVSLPIIPLYTNTHMNLKITLKFSHRIQQDKTGQMQGFSDV